MNHKNCCSKDSEKNHGADAKYCCNHAEENSHECCQNKGDSAHKCCGNHKQEKLDDCCKNHEKDHHESCCCKKEKNLLQNNCNGAGSEADGQLHSCCAHAKDSSHDCCAGGHDGRLKMSTKLILSALSLIVGFSIAHFGIKLPFFPYTDPSWIAVFFCAGPIFASAFKSAFVEKKINTAMLVSLAMIASFGLQILNLFGIDTVGGHHESYIFVVGEIAFLMALGSWLEDKTLEKTADGLAKLSNLMPKIARVKRDGKIEEIPAEQIEVGDIICVNAGEMISADAVIIKGSTSIDQSNMTGESLPVDKSVGDSVLCATFNLSSNIEIRAQKPANASAISKLIDLVKEAQGKRAPIARAANKWASYIVPTALVTAILVFFAAYYLLDTSFAAAIVRGVTVLVVFCPCAFVLAVPTAISAGIGNASKNGILIKSGGALEELSRINAVFFDKTGTLTKGSVKVSEFESHLDDKSELLKIAYAVESHLQHPLANALKEYAKANIDDGEIPEAQDVKSLVGSGVSAVVCGKKVEILKSKSDSQKTKSEMYIDKVLVAEIYFEDQVRDSAQAAVSLLLESSYKVAMLTGDNTNAALNIAHRVGISDVFANLMPQDKLDIIRNYKKRGGKVCMVGDGVNDAPSLAASDVSIAIADLRNDIAVNSAQISLLTPELKKIPALFAFSKSVMGTISTNIVISLSVSFCAILLSVFGLITPGVGALIHNASSVGVVLNSARLLNSGKLRK